MTDDEYVQRVRDRGRLLGLTLAPDTIWTAMDDALAELSEQASNGRYPHLQKDFTVAMVAGVADLSTISDVTLSCILVKSIRNVRGAADPDTGIQPEWHREYSRAGLRHEKHALGRTWFAVTNNTIYAMLDSGVEVPADQNVTFNAHFCPVITSVVPELENELIDIGLEFATREVPEVTVDTV
jgi:hypothetical protein